MDTTLGLLGLLLAFALLDPKAGCAWLVLMDLLDLLDLLLAFALFDGASWPGSAQVEHHHYVCKICKLPIKQIKQRQRYSL